jgi:hypothetical protein
MGILSGHGKHRGGRTPNHGRDKSRQPLDPSHHHQSSKCTLPEKKKKQKQKKKKKEKKEKKGRKKKKKKKKKKKCWAAMSGEEMGTRSPLP